MSRLKYFAIPYGVVAFLVGNFSFLAGMKVASIGIGLMWPYFTIKYFGIGIIEGFKYL